MLKKQKTKNKNKKTKEGNGKDNLAPSWFTQNSSVLMLQSWADSCLLWVHSCPSGLGLLFCLYIYLVIHIGENLIRYNKQA